MSNVTDRPPKMDTKALAVLKHLAENKDRITDIHSAGNEYYFRYGNHFFSILFGPSREATYGPYSFYVYPTWTADVKTLARISAEDPASEIPMVAFHSGHFGEENLAAFRDLYLALEGTQLAVDEIFDSILKSD
ncbi:MAG: hypothetical protein L0Y72_18185 [Gemmataceae bacterium]|nr:hypothetical protein [Gemmataceae bacterium]MCI0740980.1 hypothetical protein [Gemmataceae bacterium]